MRKISIILVIAIFLGGCYKGKKLNKKVTFQYFLQADRSTEITSNDNTFYGFNIENENVRQDVEVNLLKYLDKNNVEYDLSEYPDYKLFVSEIKANIEELETKIVDTCGNTEYIKYKTLDVNIEVELYKLTVDNDYEYIKSFLAFYDDSEVVKEKGCGDHKIKEVKSYIRSVSNLAKKLREQITNFIYYEGSNTNLTGNGRRR